MVLSTPLSTSSQHNLLAVPQSTPTSAHKSRTLPFRKPPVGRSSLSQVQTPASPTKPAKSVPTPVSAARRKKTHSRPTLSSLELEDPDQTFEIPTDDEDFDNLLQTTPNGNSSRSRHNLLKSPTGTYNPTYFEVADQVVRSIRKTTAEIEAQSKAREKAAAAPPRAAGPGKGKGRKSTGNATVPAVNKATPTTTNTKAKGKGPLLRDPTEERLIDMSMGDMMENDDMDEEEENGNASRRNVRAISSVARQASVRPSLSRSPSQQLQPTQTSLTTPPRASARTRKRALPSPSPPRASTSRLAPTATRITASPNPRKTKNPRLSGPSASLPNRLSPIQATPERDLAGPSTIRVVPATERAVRTKPVTVAKPRRSLGATRSRQSLGAPPVVARKARRPSMVPEAVASLPVMLATLPEVSPGPDPLAMPPVKNRRTVRKVKRMVGGEEVMEEISFEEEVAEDMQMEGVDFGGIPEEEEEASREEHSGATEEGGETADKEIDNHDNSGASRSRSNSRESSEADMSFGPAQMSPTPAQRSRSASRSVPPPPHAQRWMSISLSSSPGPSRGANSLPVLMPAGVPALALIADVEEEGDSGEMNMGDQEHNSRRYGNSEPPAPADESFESGSGSQPSRSGQENEGDYQQDEEQEASGMEEFAQPAEEEGMSQGEWLAGERDSESPEPMAQEATADSEAGDDQMVGAEGEEEDGEDEESGKQDEDMGEEEQKDGDEEQSEQASGSPEAEGPEGDNEPGAAASNSASKKPVKDGFFTIRVFRTIKGERLGYGSDADEQDLASRTIEEEIEVPINEGRAENQEIPDIPVTVNAPSAVLSPGRQRFTGWPELRKSATPQPEARLHSQPMQRIVSDVSCASGTKVAGSQVSPSEISITASIASKIVSGAGSGQGTSGNAEEHHTDMAVDLPPADSEAEGGRESPETRQERSNAPTIEGLPNSDNSAANLAASASSTGSKDNAHESADASSGDGGTQDRQNSLPGRTPRQHSYLLQLKTTPSQGIPTDGEIDEDGYVVPVVEVISSDPRAAARAVAYLKLNHQYTAHSNDSPPSLSKKISRETMKSQTPRKHARRRSKHFDSIAAANKLSPAELLLEAEAEIAALSDKDNDEQQSLATTRKRFDSASVVQDPPGSFRKAELIERGRQSGRATRIQRMKPDMKVWGTGDWQNMERCYKQAVKNVIEKGKRKKSEREGVFQPDPNVVVDMFLGIIGLEEIDLKDEWTRPLLHRRAVAINIRLMRHQPVHQTDSANTGDLDEPPAKRPRVQHSPEDAPMQPDTGRQSQPTTQVAPKGLGRYFSFECLKGVVQMSSPFKTAVPNATAPTARPPAKSPAEQSGSTPRALAPLPAPIVRRAPAQAPPLPAAVTALRAVPRSSLGPTIPDASYSTPTRDMRQIPNRAIASLPRGARVSNESQFYKAVKDLGFSPGGGDGSGHMSTPNADPSRPANVIPRRSVGGNGTDTPVQNKIQQWEGKAADAVPEAHELKRTGSRASLGGSTANVTRA